MNGETENEIRRLKQERGAVILAHNYVAAEIQDIADFCGDSLELSIKARDAHAEVIVCCGVRFMAETAKILSPDAVVLVPAPDAGCPMADMASPEAVRRMRENNPDALFVAYVNTTAATKAGVDICCTSGNAEKIIAGLPADREIVFLPDRNLGRNVSGKLGRKMTFWEGCCPIHDTVTPETVLAARAAHPGAPVLVHPECRPETAAAADAALSTAGMMRYVRESPAAEFVIGTETGILHRLRKENPDRKFYPLDPGLICRDMKKITLADVRDCLLNMNPRVELDAGLMRRAGMPIEKMLG